MFNPEEYMISIQKEMVDGELLFVARVEELPDVIEYADSYEFARELVIDTISTAMRVFQAENAPFPEPNRARANVCVVFCSDFSYATIQKNETLMANVHMGRGYWSLLGSDKNEFNKIDIVPRLYHVIRETDYSIASISDDHYGEDVMSSVFARARDSLKLRDSKNWVGAK